MFQRITIDLWALVLLTVLLLAGCGGGSAPANEYGLTDWSGFDGDTGPQPGQRAPNFKLATPDGGEIVLADQTGQPILLNFFATWCTNCREEMAALEVAAGQGLMVIGIDLRESAEKVSTLAAETGVTFPLALDSSGKVTREYRVTSLPVTFLLDPIGNVVTIVPGPINAAKIAEMLAIIDGEGESS